MQPSLGPFGHIIITSWPTTIIVSFCLCFAVGPRAETGNVAAGRRSATGGQRAPPARAGSAATPPWGPETLRSPLLTGSESGRGNGNETERRRRRKKKRSWMRRRRKKSCWNPPGSAARMLRTTTPTTPWTKWYRLHFCLYYIHPLFSW